MYASSWWCCYCGILALFYFAGKDEMMIIGWGISSGADFYIVENVDNSFCNELF